MSALKKANYAAVEKRIAALMKMQAKEIDALRFYSSASPKGRRVMGAPFGAPFGFQNIPKYELTAKDEAWRDYAGWMQTDDEPFADQCWARAFFEVLGVAHSYYLGLSPAQRREREAHYTTLAKNDTQKGRRAARVVAVRVKYMLRGEMYEKVKMNPSVQQFYDQITAYDFISGKTANTVVVDDMIDTLRHVYTSTTEKKP